MNPSRTIDQDNPQGAPIARTQIDSEPFAGLPSSHRIRRGLLALLACALLGIASRGAAGRSDSAPSFINDVAPILQQHCCACHDARKRAGKLDVTTFAKLRNGGVHGDPIVPGKPEESLLVERLRATDGRRMPPPAKDRPDDPAGALPPNQREVIEKWIAAGAPLDPELTPDVEILRELRKRWRPPAPPERYPRPVPIVALAFSPDGQRLVAGGLHELTLWDAKTGGLLGRLRTRAERSFSLAFISPTQLAAAGGRPGQDGDVRIYDLAAPPRAIVDGIACWDGVEDPHTLIAHLDDGDDCFLAVAVSTDRQRLAAGGCDRCLRLWSITGGAAPSKLEQSVELHADWILALAFTPDGRYLLSGSRDKTAKVWDLARRESTATFGEHQHPVYAVASRPDGKSAVSAGGDRRLRYWQFEPTISAIKTIGGHEDEILRLAASPAQPLVVTASMDQSVRVWTTDGAAVRTLGTLSAPVYSLAISPDGSRVAAGSAAGEIRIWSLHDGATLASFLAAPGLAARP